MLADGLVYGLVGVLFQRLVGVPFRWPVGVPFPRLVGVLAGGVLIGR
jgi:hypothetical protein